MPDITWWSETERRKRGRHRSKSAGNAINVAGAEDEALGVDRKWRPRRGESATEIAQVSPETPSVAKIERYPTEMALNTLEVAPPKITGVQTGEGTLETQNVASVQITHLN